LRGASAGKEVVVRGPRFFIGRSEECHLRANSDAISRRHCAITVQDEVVKIRDLGSRNGTYVNGTRIDGDHRLEMGDQLRVGPLEFLVTYLVQAKSKTSSPSAKAASDDMDGLIGDWLLEADEQEKSRPPGSGETREFRLDDTKRIDAKLTKGASEVPTEVSKSADVAPVEEEPAAVEDTSQAGPGNADQGHIGPGQEMPGGRGHGHGPRKPPKAVPKDTQEAAAQTLRKFFNRGS
jgi:pSer/pThr/pTyr-binding forkhead associated (FHA) protein